MRHPAVLEAAAVAVPSDLGEDDILVVVTVAPDAGLDHAELLDFCSARMPYFCVPRYLEVRRRDSEERDRASPQGRAAQEGSQRRTHGTASITATS